MLSDPSASEEQDRSRLFWALAAILLLLLLAGLIWIWWSGSKSPAPPRVASAASATMAAAPPAKPVAAPAMSFDIPFGYHAFAVRPNEASEVTNAAQAWRTYNMRQCGQACSCGNSARLEVVGHADRRTGTAEFNRCISWKRAMVTADALAGQGVPRCDVATAFVGASDIRTPESDEQSAAAHRRASIAIVARNTSGGSPPAGQACAGACRSSLSRAETRHCEALLKEPPLLHQN